MKLLYVAGPYRAPTQDGIQKHIDQAREAGKLAAQRGWYPVIPHMNTAHFDAELDLDDRFYLDGTLELMRRCDAVLVCGGWEQSAGTLGEIEEARQLGLSVYFRLTDVPMHEAAVTRVPCEACIN